MHIQFATLFADPKTSAPLALEASERRGDRIIFGALVSPTARYPIVRGIPRFVPFETDNYSRSFGYQWNRWPRLQFDSENVGRPMQGHTGQMFERITGQNRGQSRGQNRRQDSLAGQLILDIGCGPGRFIETARSKGAKVIGIDYSTAVEAAARNFSDDPNVCICQADALKLPLPADSVDGAYSIGVLHHTPDPRQGVHEAARVVRPGGWFALSVYGQGGYYDFPTVKAWRRIFRALWPIAGHYPPLLYSYATAYGLRPLAAILPWLGPLGKLGPLLGKALRLPFPSVQLPDVRWSFLDTFDSVTPSYQSAHQAFEVFQWLKSGGMEEIEPADWGLGAFHARQPAAHIQAV
jgi:SAM-dependent methyltransferase